MHILLSFRTIDRFFSPGSAARRPEIPKTNIHKIVVNQNKIDLLITNDKSIEQTLNVMIS